jgi:putative addiction module component (TIGR02574 family)
MSTEHKAILDELLTLPPDERARLAEQLMESLEVPDERISELWANEAERRLDAYERGDLKAVPGAEVIARLRSKFPK